LQSLFAQLPHAYCGFFHFYFEAASGLMNQIGLNPDSEVTAAVWTDGQGYQYEAAILRGTDLCVCGKARKRLYKQDIIDVSTGICILCRPAGLGIYFVKRQRHLTNVYRCSYLEAM
jgi:hypothetical protein